MKMQNQIFYSFLLIIAIPTVAFFIMVITFFTGVIEERTITASELVVKESVKRIDTRLNGYREASMQIYFNEDIMNILAAAAEQGEMNRRDELAVQELLGSFVNADKYLMSAILRTDSGIISEGSDFLDIATYMDAQSEALRIFPGRIIWIPTQELKSAFGLSSRYFGVMRLIRRNNSEIGEVLFLVREEFFDDIYAGAIPDFQGDDVVLTEGGIVVSASEKAQIGIGSADPRMIDLIGHDLSRDGHSIVEGISGQNYFIHAQSSESGWFFIREMSEAEIFSGVDTLKKSLVAIIILFCLFLVFLTFILSRGLGRPLRELAGHIDRIGSDNLDIPVMRNHLAGDEIGRLERSLLEMSARIKALIEDVSREEQAKTHAELKALRNHISPHFVYNTLDTIRWMAVINKQENIRQVVSALDNLLRYAADIETILINLEEELDIIQEYVVIQSMRYPDIELVVDIPAELREMRVNKFLIQTLVENSIVHGFHNLEGTGVIHITAKAEVGVLLLTVRDNGCGFDSGVPLDNGHHTGLKNVNLRLKLNYGEGYGVTVESQQDEGTTAVLKLPLIG